MARFDDDAAVEADLLLESGVGVIPVSARLADGEAVGEGAMGFDGQVTDVRDSILEWRDEKPVPVKRCGGIESVGNVDDRGVTFVKPECGSWDGVIDTECWALVSCEIDRFVTDGEAVNDLFSRECAGEKKHGQKGIDHWFCHF